MSSIKLFNGDDRQLYRSAQVLDVFGFSDMVRNDTLYLEYTLMDRTTDDLAPWVVISPSSYSLKLGLFTDADVQLAFQNSFVDDVAGGKKTGTLSLSDAALTTALGSSEKITPWFEIRIDDATGARTMYRRKVVVTRHAITDSNVTVPPTETAMTTTTANSLYVPKDGSNPATPCDQIIMLSRPSGLTKIVTISDDGVLAVTNV